MYTRILNTWSQFRESFWFLPSLLIIAAIITAFLMIGFDKSYGSEVVKRLPFLEMSPPAARSILSSIVAAMVSTTGVVFSITIVALSLSSSHFGSRLIRTFRNRLSTHFALGIFVSTSLFCIIVLASIRELDALQFVPTTSVALGIVLSVVCLMTLVYYIHDTSRAIEAPNVIQRSADDLHEAIQRLFPESIGDGNTESEEFDTHEQDLQLGQSAHVLLADGVGYLQAVGNESIMSLAENYNLLVKLEVRPGDFVYEGIPIAKLFASGESEAVSVSSDGSLDFDPDVLAKIRSCFIVGPERTHIQDVRHAFNEVVDIAVRALSPGTNDPFTAINCVDRIHAALMLFISRKMPGVCRYDSNGDLRLVAKRVELEECIQGSLGIIHNYAVENPNVLDRVETAMASLDERIRECTPS